MSTFAPQRVKSARLEAGKSYEQVAVEVDRSAQVVYAYETGRVVPPTTILGRLATALGVSVAEFFEDGSQ